MHPAGDAAPAAEATRPGSSGAPPALVRSGPRPQLAEEAIELLRQYLRIPTVNDPQALTPDQARDEPWRAGCEAEAAEWLAGRLAAGGIEAELLESAPGRVNVLARLEGRRRGDAVLLLSHSDVVPVGAEEWSRGIDPFGGEIHDGYLYGRGALDLKGLGIVHLATLIELRRAGVELDRDVVMLVAADEEAGGKYGSDWLLGQRPELLETAVVLGEGAYSPRGLLPYDGPVHAVAVGEKGYLELELTVEESAHHASMPAARNATSRLVAALDRVLTMRRPIRVTPLAGELLECLAEAASGLRRFVFRRPRLAARLAAGHLSESSILSAMLRDTLAVTVLEAGGKHNVVPSRARAVLSIRFLPETDPDELTEEIRSAIADPGVRIDRLMHKPANASPFDTPSFRTLCRHAVAGVPDGLVTPILSPGASDCRFWRRHRVDAYGWIPFVIGGEDLHGVHGPDERVSLDAFAQGLASYYDAVCELVTAA